MKITNLTNKPQVVSLQECLGDHKVFSIWIAPKGITEVERVRLLNPEKYVNILEIEGNPLPITTVSNNTLDVQEVVDEDEEEVPEETGENEETTETVSPDSFICDICKAEFASARGLATHMSKAHPNE